MRRSTTGDASSRPPPPRATCRKMARSRRRNPDEFGARGPSSRADAARGDVPAHAPAAALERGAGDLTATRDYARAAEELAFVLERCVASAEKPAVRAAHEDALLAAKLVSGLDREMDARAARRVHAAALAVLPAQKRAAFESAYKTASVERARKLKLGRRAASSCRRRRMMSIPISLIRRTRPPADVADFPVDVLNLAIGRLALRDLARASCVSRIGARVEEADAVASARARAFGRSDGCRSDAARTRTVGLAARPGGRAVARARARRETSRAWCRACRELVWAHPESDGGWTCPSGMSGHAPRPGVAGARLATLRSRRGGRVVFRVIQLVQLVRIERRGRRGGCCAAVPAVEHPAGDDPDKKGLPRRDDAGTGRILTKYESRYDNTRFVLCLLARLTFSSSLVRTPRCAPHCSATRARGRGRRGRPQSLRACWSSSTPAAR